MKEIANDKTKKSMFQNELDVIKRTQNTRNKPGITNKQLQAEYQFLSAKYEKLVKEMIKITRIGDMHYKKLMEANDQIQEHKNILEELTQQLLDANAAKDRFYSIIAHDLRNPLQVLLFSADLMAEEYEQVDEEAIKKFIQQVNHTAHNMSNLLENLLQWARFQYGELECQPETINLFLLAKENIQYFVENAEKKNISISMRIPENTWVYADENMIKSVLRNLVNNSVKFTHPGGKIKIFSKKEGDFIIISVQDTGIGIPKEKLDDLFQNSKRKHVITTGTAEEKGSSLGLLICKEFVEKNGGTIRVKSEPGKGSTFEFSLPTP
ncbi:MAG: HAMP domain-containing sensor histidine kinase [Candidatus Aminicenantes bacterium]|jgi:signal transduction histidine kinase